VAQRANQLGHILRFEEFVTLLINHLALIVGDVVVLQQLLSNVEVAGFHLALRGLDGTRHDTGFDRLALRHLQPVHDGTHAVASEDTQQGIVQRQVEAR
jgi:hypothetical protein